MKRREMTSDEKLLDLIDNPASARPRARLKPTLSTLASLRGWLGRVGARLGDQKKPVLTLRRVNQWLMAVCVIATVGLTAEFLATRKALHRRLQTIERVQPGGSQNPTGTSPPSFTLDEALEAATQRNVFTFLPPKVEASPSPVVTELENAVKELKLVGILWSSTPQAIIEQPKDARTHLLGTGDALGPLRVKKIFQDRVILGQDDGPQEWELR